MRPKTPAAGVLRLGDFRQNLFTDSTRRFGTRIPASALSPVTALGPDISPPEMGIPPTSASPPGPAANAPAGVRADPIRPRPLPVTDAARVAPEGRIVRHVIGAAFRPFVTPDRLSARSPLPLGAVPGGLLAQLLSARATLWGVGLATALSSQPYQWIRYSPPRTPRDIPEGHVLGGSPTGTARQGAAGTPCQRAARAGESASSGFRPSWDDRTGSA